MQREVPEEIILECPDCDDYTTHEVLRGKVGKATFEGTFRCAECGRTFSTTLRIPKVYKIPVVISDGPVSEKSVTELEEDEVLAIGDEFFLEDGRRLRVCSIDLGSEQRKKKAKVQDIKTIWAQQFDVLNLKVTINDNRKSYSRRIEGEPDDEFLIGQVLALADMECYIHAIKTRERLVTKGTVEARDVVRIYGKMKRKTVPILELDDEEDDEDIEF